MARRSAMVNPFRVEDGDRLVDVEESLRWVARTTGKPAVLIYGSLLLTVPPVGKTTGRTIPNASLC